MLRKLLFKIYLHFKGLITLEKVTKEGVNVIYVPIGANMTRHLERKYIRELTERFEKKFPEFKVFFMSVPPLHK